MSGSNGINTAAVELTGNNLSAENKLTGQNGYQAAPQIQVPIKKENHSAEEIQQVVLISKNQTLTRIVIVLSLLLFVSIVALIAVAATSGDSGDSDETSSSSYFWTKAGLETIPTSDWISFAPADQEYLPYISNFPFPQDSFTGDHFDAWNSVVDSSATYADLLEQGFITMEIEDPEEIMSVPTLYSDPIVLTESAIDYRLQYAADLGHRDLVGSAMKGRLVNPAGRRLREHFYRFPDQCDATSIALEVFLRLAIYHQIEAFYTEMTIGIFHDLFPEVDRRAYDNFDLNLARWYGERYAESYVHKTTNNWVNPSAEQNIDTYIRALGLDPEDPSEDHTTAVGLGNLVGRRVTEWLHENDLLGRETDFVDEVGLKRIDDYHNATEWHQWQPTLAGSGRFQGLRHGIVTRQTFVSPSLGIFSFLYDNETDYINLGLLDAIPVLDTSEDAYIARTDEFLQLTSSLTDQQKAVAELAQNKISGSVFLILAYVKILKEVAPAEDYYRLYDEFSMITSACGEYAATHATWRHKRTYLAGRPKTVINELLARNSAFSAANPDAGSFEPLIAGGDHPEYPSGSAVIYSSFAQAADDWFFNKFGIVDASKNTGPLSFTIEAGKFYWSEGPAVDVTLEYDSLDEWIQELPISRVYGGVHFLEAGEAGLVLGKKVGQACTRLLDRLNAGDLTATYPASSREHVQAFNI